MKVQVQFNPGEYLAYLELLRRVGMIRSRVPEALNSGIRKGYQKMVDVITAGTQARTGALSSPVITYANVGNMMATISPNPEAISYAAYQDQGTRGGYPIPKVKKVPPKLLVSTWPPGTVRVLGYQVVHPGISKPLNFSTLGAMEAEKMLMDRLTKIFDETII